MLGNSNPWSIFPVQDEHEKKKNAVSLYYITCYFCLYLNILLAQPIRCFSIGGLGSIGQDFAREMSLEMWCLHLGKGRKGLISITGLPSLPVQGGLHGCPSVFLIFLTLCRLLVVVFQFVCNLSYHVLIEGKGCQLFKTSSGVFIYICWTAALSCLTLICSRPVRNIHKLAKDNTSAKYIGRWLEILKTDVI